MFQKQLGKYTKAHRILSKKDDEENHHSKINLPVTLFNRSPQKIFTTTSSLASSKKLSTPLRQRLGGVSPLRRQFESLNPNKINNLELNYQSTPSNLNPKLLNSSQKSINNSLKSSCNKAICSHPTHKDKLATFLVLSDDNQNLPYCQKCAILLASQGFAVSRSIPQQMTVSTKQQLDIQDIKIAQRRQQIIQFITQVQQTISKLNVKQQNINSRQVKNTQLFKQCESNINIYFNYLQQILQDNRKQIISELKQVYFPNTNTTNNSTQLQSIKHSCDNIKQDIMGSIYKINSAHNDVYSGIMGVYWAKLQDYNNIISSYQIKEIIRHIITSNDVRQVGKQLNNLIYIQIQHQQPPKRIIQLKCHPTNTNNTHTSNNNKIVNSGTSENQKNSDNNQQKNKQKFNLYFSFDNGNGQTKSYQQQKQDQNDNNQNILDQL